MRGMTFFGEYLNLFKIEIFYFRFQMNTSLPDFHGFQCSIQFLIEMQFPNYNLKITFYLSEQAFEISISVGFKMTTKMMNRKNTGCWQIIVINQLDWFDAKHSKIAKSYHRIFQMYAPKWNIFVYQKKDYISLNFTQIYETIIDPPSTLDCWTYRETKFFWHIFILTSGTVWIKQDLSSEIKRINLILWTDWNFSPVHQFKLEGVSFKEEQSLPPYSD